MIAYAAQNGANQAGSIGGLFMPLIIMGFFLYFFVVRPQKKRQKEVTDMRSSLKVGDKVILYSGLNGTIIEIKDDLIVLECLPDNIKLTFKNWSIREVVFDDELEDEIIEDEEVEEQVEQVEEKENNIDLEKK